MHHSKSHLCFINHRLHSTWPIVKVTAASATRPRRGRVVLRKSLPLFPLLHCRSISGSVSPELCCCSPSFCVMHKHSPVSPQGHFTSSSAILLLSPQKGFTSLINAFVLVYRKEREDGCKGDEWERRLEEAKKKKKSRKDCMWGRKEKVMDEELQFRVKKGKGEEKKKCKNNFKVFKGLKDLCTSRQWCRIWRWLCFYDPQKELY